MKVAALILFLVLPVTATFGQVRGADFQLTKITKNLVSTPQFAYTGGQQYPANQRDRWLEPKVEFGEGIARTIEYFKGCRERGELGERIQ